MTKNKTKSQNIIEDAAAQVETDLNREDTYEETTSASRERPKRKKVYERVREAHIPNYVREMFAKDGYEVRLVRWAVLGDIDYRNLNRRLEEGYEFVTKEELPAEFVQRLRIRDTNVTKGMLTNGGDLCYMKVDSDLRQSRQDYYHNQAQQEVDAVNINVTGARKGLLNTGTKSKVMLREPSFQD